MKTTYAWLLVLLLGGQALAQLPKALPDQAAIASVLAAQTRSWNNGNLNEFMRGYWQSDSLQFIGSNGITTGWQNTLDNYQKRYPNRAAMGTLRFEILRLELLGRENAFVVGKFYLTRPEKGDAQGYFTLLWRKVNGTWVITTDHTG